MLFAASCKKENNDSDQQSQAHINKLKTEWSNEGFLFHARLYTQESQRWDEFFLGAVDVRSVNGTIKCAYTDKVGILSQQGENFETKLHFGEIQNNKFVRSNYATCADLNDQTSDYRKFYHFDIDNTGRFFTAYTYYPISSSYIGTYQTFCTSDGINLGSEYFDKNSKWRQTKGIVTAVSFFHNGLEIPQLKYLTVQAGVVSSALLTPAAAQIQDANYIATDGGNAFLCYSSLDNGGELHLMGNDGATWVNLGKVPVSSVVGSTYISKIVCVRNGEEPYFIMMRENNTAAIAKFNGVSLELISDYVILQTSGYLAAAFLNYELNNGTFCVYKNKLMMQGVSNNDALNGKTIYQLNGNTFTPVETLTFSNTRIVGIYADNQKLYAAVEVLTADNGLFRSPIDIVELQ